MNTQIELLKQKISKIPDSGNERSFYTALCNFFEEYGKTVVKLRAPQAIAEESLSKNDKNIGFPDITIRNGQTLIGWVEIKLPSDELDSGKFKAQFGKYRDSLENIVFTNLRDWQLWQWVKDERENKIEARQVAKVSFDITKINGVDSSKFENFLAKFFEGRAHEARTPKQLALALAKKTRLLSKQVEEALDAHGVESDLSRLKETFEKTLIQDISPHQFANMVSETLAYSLFLAALEHGRRGNDEELTLTNAIDYLPTNVPILADLYSLIKKVATTIPSITDAARLLVDQLNASDIDRIRQKLVEHKLGEDPVIQFYEPFLAEYDPKEREARGVYYTPKPVVDYIVKSVDILLREKFGKAKGLADESVHLLDPATGTGTFLMSAIQQIYSDTKKRNEAQGEVMVQKVFNEIVLNHILKHFYGFELLIAPYAIAHLKLTLEVERLGFDFALTRDDGDKDNDRFKIYLANTLDDPNKPPAKLFVGYEAIPQESESARKIKSDMPILAIVGNPPYSNFGRMNRGKWILDLLKDYKQNLKEKKINLDDDFIKFIRFAQWKLEKTGQGIFAMITSNTFIDGITHRQMRRSLMDTFDEIYIYDLHGNSRKGEVAPGGGKDENVFAIQSGVSINIFVKHPEKQRETDVRYAELWGPREKKFSSLVDEDLIKTNWRSISPQLPNWFFIPKDNAVQEEYEKFRKVTDIFPLHNSGIQTGRDDPTLQFEENKIAAVVADFRSKRVDELKNKYALVDSSGWTTAKARADIMEHQGEIAKLLYRPFDYRYTYFTGKSAGFLKRPRTDTMRHLIKGDNLGMILVKQLVLEGSYNHFGVSNSAIDERTFLSNRGGTYIAPLYLYPEHFESLFDGVMGTIPAARQPNVDLLTAREIASKIDKVYYPVAEYPTEKDEDRLTPEDIFYYAYAIFHCPTYRSRYAEQLKIDFPRLPFTSDKTVFSKLVKLGKELVDLHLLGENPLNRKVTIFDKPAAWGVKVGGMRADGLEDWKVTEVRYSEKEQRVYVNPDQYIEGIPKDIWEFIIGGYQVCEKWLKERKKTGRTLSTDDLKHYMKIIVSLRETIRLMEEVDNTIPEWPLR